MASLSPEQQHVLRSIVRIGRRRGASRKDILAAIETGLVESNLTNPDHGDGTSVGWRQETSSSYPGVNRLDLRASINRFYNEARAVEGRYRRPGDLAAAVQRPAAQYRGRYAQRGIEARQLLRSLGGGGGGGVPSAGQAGGGSRTVTSTIPGVDNSSVRNQLVMSFLNQGGVKNSSALLPFVAGMRQAQDVPASTVTRTIPGASSSGPAIPAGQANGAVAQFVKAANEINAKHLPYSFGGGHAGRVDPKHPVPLDCSGAVSAVLGISPRVSGAFLTYGKAGRGRRVTIWVRPGQGAQGHVLLEVDGRFFGTSGANPGGGAGWIPRGRINSSYLKGFVARHPNGL